MSPQEILAKRRKVKALRALAERTDYPEERSTALELAERLEADLPPEPRERRPRFSRPAPFDRREIVETPELDGPSVQIVYVYANDGPFAGGITARRARLPYPHNFIDPRRRR